MAKKEVARKTERVTATYAYRHFAACVDRARFAGERFIVTQHGEDAVVIIAAAELARLEGAAA